MKLYPRAVHHHLTHINKQTTFFALFFLKQIMLLRKCVNYVQKAVLTVLE